MTKIIQDQIDGLTATIAELNFSSGVTSAIQTQLNGKQGTATTSTLTSLGLQVQALDMNSHKINNVTDPSSAQDAATKNYVDNATAGLTSKASSRMATTANLVGTYLANVFTYTSTGVQTVDGVTPALADRVLLKNQTSTFQNGIYTWTTLGAVGVAGVLTRSSDFNSSTNITEGAYTIIEEGTVNAGTLWVETGQGPFTVGTTPIVFTELQVANQTLTLTGAVTGSGAGSIATTIATPGTLTVATSNSTATAHTHAITSSSAPGAAAALLATDSSGIIGSTGTRIVKGWFIDLTVTNNIAGSITGNAATVTTNANLTGPITSSGNATSIASQTGTGTKFVVDTDPALTVSTPTTTSFGYLGAPQNSQSADYTFILTDAGKSIYHPAADTTARTWTIPANGSVAYPLGTVIVISNENAAGVITLAITTDTLRWGSSTGSRSIAANGTATLYKATSTSWRLTGDGIT